MERFAARRQALRHRRRDQRNQALSDRAGVGRGLISTCVLRDGAPRLLSMTKIYQPPLVILRSDSEAGASRRTHRHVLTPESAPAALRSL